MARADRRTAQRQARRSTSGGSRRAAAGRRATSARAIEHTLFFTRLRRQAKWAFVLMVLVFSVGFVFLGVGSGGLDLGSLIRDTFGNKGGGGGTSISKAQHEVQLHPRRAAAYKQLADAYERKGMETQAISALEQYTVLAPHDVTQLRRLAQIELVAATDAENTLRLAYLQQQSGSGNSLFTQPTGGKLGKALGPDPIAQAVAAKTSADLQKASSAFQTASSKAIATLTRITKVEPIVPNFVQLANAAAQLSNPTAAIKAYRQALALKNVDPATRRQIRARIAELRRSLSNSGG